MNTIFKKRLMAAFGGSMLGLGLAAGFSSAHATDQKGAKVELSKVMSKDELRACMKLKTDISDLAKQLEQRKQKLAVEREELRSAQTTPAQRPQQAELDNALIAYKAADAAVQAHAKTIDQWNAQVKELDDSTMKSAERQKQKLLSQRKALEEKNAGLLQEREDKSKIYSSLVDKFNALSQQSKLAAESWNKRNDELADDGDKLIDMRTTYGADCSNRRFREDDEAAIKVGK